MENTGSAMAPKGLRAEGAASYYRPPDWFGRRDVLEFARTLDPPVRADVASRAFGVLLRNWIDLGLEVRCGFAVHRNRFCPAPHWIRSAEFLATPAESILAARGCGRALAAILTGFRHRLEEG